MHFTRIYPILKILPILILLSLSNLVKAMELGEATKATSFDCKAQYKDLFYDYIERRWDYGGEALEKAAINMFGEFVNKFHNKTLDLSIPKEFHYIWLGGPIYEEYWNHITKLSSIAKSSGYNVNIWVDTAQNLRKLKVKDKEESRIIDNSNYDDYINRLKLIKVHTLEELEIKSKELDGFPPKFFTYYWKFFNNELHGLSNFAAASDLLRYLILYLQGGIYLDTDLVPLFESPLDIGKVEPLYGFRVMESQNTPLVASKQHPIMGCSLLASVGALLKLECSGGMEFKRKHVKLLTLTKEARLKLSKVLPLVSLDDNAGQTSRVVLTILTTGPNVVGFAIKEFVSGVRRSLGTYADVVNSLYFELNKSTKDIRVVTIGNLPIGVKCDKTWCKITHPRYIEDIK